MSQTSRDVEIHLPLETLIKIICQLPEKDLIEVRQQIDVRLQNHLSDPLLPVEDSGFWATDLGQSILAEADDRISMDDALKATARIKGSLAAEVAAERDER
jgi:hypothetical protein